MSDETPEAPTPGPSPPSPNRITYKAATEFVEVVTPKRRGDPRVGATWRATFPSRSQAIVALPFVIAMTVGVIARWSEIVPSADQIQRTRDAMTALAEGDYERADQLAVESILDDERDVTAIVVAYCARGFEQRWDDAAAALVMAVEEGAHEIALRCNPSFNAPAIPVPIGPIATAVIPNTDHSRSAYEELGNQGDIALFGDELVDEPAMQPVITIACDAIALGYEALAHRWIEVSTEIDLDVTEVARGVATRCGQDALTCDSTGCFPTQEFSSEINRERFGRTGYGDE